MKYFSQYSQDKIADYILSKKNGTFVDIGANDGISYSNSYIFEKEMNWKGICIEPINETYKQLIKNRQCICLNIGVWSKEGVLKFYRANGYAEMLSGIVESFHDEHYCRLKKEIEQSGGTLEIIEIEVYPLNKILEEHKLYEIDFCSIDTEGSEFEILQAIDYEKFSIKIFAVENTYDLSKIREFMSTKGYKLLMRLGGDDIFILGKEYKKTAVKFNIFRFWLDQRFTAVINRFKK